MHLLTVGELARRSGLTVRALHHFDSLGLLKPTARSDAGYRLYGRDDVARLHAIQALREMGIPLKQIGNMVAGDGSDLPDIVQRQLRALDEQMAQAAALRQRLETLNELLRAGQQAALDDWLGTLSLMSTYNRYLSPDEVQRLVAVWPAVAPQWTSVVTALRACLTAGLPPNHAEVQALTQRWMALMHAWQGGDFDLMERWGQMYAAEPGVRGSAGPELSLVQYVEQASATRMALWRAHFSLDEMSRLRPVNAAALDGLDADVTAAITCGQTPQEGLAQELVQRWVAALTETMGGDHALALRLAHAYAAEPALRLGSRLTSPVIEYLLAARQHHAKSA